jgi:hypothetical protein
MALNVQNWQKFDLIQELLKNCDLNSEITDYFYQFPAGHNTDLNRLNKISPGSNLPATDRFPPAA